VIPGLKTRDTYLSVILCAAVCVCVFLLAHPRDLFNDPTSTVIEDRTGVLLGAHVADDGQWRFPPSDSLQGKYVISLIHYEDRYFYLHPGVNPVSLARSAWKNLRSFSIVSGGSTITMQVIRMSRKNRPRTVTEKIIEILLAVRLELSFSKEDILGLYASNAPFGGNVVGIEAAAWRYFGRSHYDLSWAEAATLAVLPNAPALIHPGRNREELKSRRDGLLEKLYQREIIDSLTCRLSMLEELPEKPHPLPMHASHLLGGISLSHRGDKIRTTLDHEVQQRIVNLVERHHNLLKNNEIYNMACLVLETGSGNILAYVGNTKNPGNSEHGNDVDIITSPRSTGSILKPVLFGLMLEEGDILPGTLVPDIPTQYTGYSPKNFSLTYNGVVPARRALARSLNIPAVRMLQQYGLEKFHYYLPRLGISTLNRPADHYGLSLILGGAEGTLWDITGLYASLGRILLNYNINHSYRQGDIHSPNYFTNIKEKNSRVPSAAMSVPMSAGSIWLTFQSLIEVNRPASEAGWKNFSSSGLIAWKTGTSFGFRDGWAIGTTPEFTVGVWAGNADGEGRPGLTGIAAAAPLLFDVFGVLPETSWFPVPNDDIYPAEVCRQSGHLPGPYCNNLDTVLVSKNGLRSAPCPYHILAHLSPDGLYRVSDNCFEPHRMHHESWFVLPPVQEWYFRSSNPSYRPLPELHPDCDYDESVIFMDLIYPRHSARVYVPYELDGTRGELILEAAHRDPSSTIHWHLDENYLGSTSHLHQLGIIPAGGWHTLTLVDNSGNILTHRFEVIDR